MGHGLVHFPLLPASSSRLFFLDVVSVDATVVVIGLVDLFVVVGLLVSATVSAVTVVDLFVAGSFVVSVVGSAFVVIAAAAAFSAWDAVPFLVEALFGAEAVDDTAFQALASPGVVAAVRSLAGGGRS